jgi:hypothetical protein
MSQVQFPDCFGNKRCAKGPNNTARVWCPCYHPCLDDLISKKLHASLSPLKLLFDLRGVCPALSDFMILRRIGRVASKIGFAFGRKKVDRAIRESDIRLDADPSLEGSEIRRAFGVHGRRGCTRARSTPIGLTAKAETCATAILIPSPGITPGYGTTSEPRPKQDLPFAPEANPC